MADNIDRHIDDNVIRLYVKNFSTVPNWMLDAECSLNDDGSLDPIADAEEIAQKYCPQCPVRQQCEQWAQENSLQSGVYGGKVH